MGLIKALVGSVGGGLAANVPLRVMPDKQHGAHVRKGGAEVEQGAQARSGIFVLRPLHEFIAGVDDCEVYAVFAELPGKRVVRHGRAVRVRKDFAQIASMPAQVVNEEMSAFGLHAERVRLRSHSLLKESRHDFKVEVCHAARTFRRRESETLHAARNGQAELDRKERLAAFALAE